MSNVSPSVLQSSAVYVYRRLFRQLIFLVCALSVASQATAQQASAETAAKSFVSHLETLNAALIYDTELGPTFTQAVKKDQFVANTGMLKIQSGGPALARQLVGSQGFSQTPTGQTGTFYYVRFKTKFPSGFAFQDVYLEQIDSQWKISGYWIAAAPN